MPSVRGIDIMKKCSLLLILIMLTLLIATGCRKQVFVGISAYNSSMYKLDYSNLNTTKTHEIKFKKGEAINVIIENKSGKLDISVSDSNGEKVYRGDNATSGKFSIEIPKTDTYKFSVTGSNTKGSVVFKLAD